MAVPISYAGCRYSVPTWRPPIGRHNLLGDLNSARSSKYIDWRVLPKSLCHRVLRSKETVVFTECYPMCRIMSPVSPVILSVICTPLRRPNLPFLSFAGLRYYPGGVNFFCAFDYLLWDICWLDWLFSDLFFYFYIKANIINTTPVFFPLLFGIVLPHHRAIVPHLLYGCILTIWV